MLVLLIIFMVVTPFLQQGITVALPKNLNNPDVDPNIIKESSIVISIPNDGEYYLGKQRVAREQLTEKVDTMLKGIKNEQDRIVYIKSGVGVSYGDVVNVINEVRKLGVDKIGLVADKKKKGGAAPAATTLKEKISMAMGGSPKKGSTTAEPYINVTPLIDVLLVLLIIFMVVTPLKPSRFKADIPTQRDPNEDLSKLKPNPLTLVVTIAPDLSIKLNQDSLGSVNDPTPLAQRLLQVFAQRKEQRAYKVGMETRTDVKEDERIEKTVFVKAPRATKYGDVVKVIDAIKGAGASPVGLQVDDLP
jgi:biopolymer transport protein ExbD/biopolymer transport protein TolR